MRLNTFMAVLSCIAAILLSFAIHSYSGEQTFLLGIGSFVGIGVSLIAGIAVSFESIKISMLSRTASWIIIVAQIILQFVFAMFETVHFATYLLFSGLLMIAQLAIVYHISRIKV